jgi:hypothetical protein
MDRNHLHYLSDGDLEELPPPYTLGLDLKQSESQLKKHSPPSKFQVLWREISKDAYSLEPEKEKQMEKEKEENRIKALYPFVHINQFAFDLEISVYSALCYNTKEILDKFYQHPP